MDAAVSVYGKSIRARLFEVQAGGEGESQISGFVSNPNYLFKSAKNQTVLINGRYVKSAGIQGALSRAYGERLMKGHFPFAVLNIRLPLSDVDVNVHPNKTNVLIQNEEELLIMLDGAVKNALTLSSLPRFELETKKEPAAKAEPVISEEIKKEPEYKPEPQPPVVDAAPSNTVSGTRLESQTAFRDASERAGGFR